MVDTTATQTGEALAERRSMTMMVASSMAEGIAGIGAIVLSILGLSRIFPEMMLPVATIAVGASLIFQGGFITSRFSNLLTAETRGRMDFRELGMGITTEFFGGAVGLVIGVLSLLGVYPLILIPAATIVFGSALVLGSGVTGRLNSLWVASTEERELVREVSREAMSSAVGLQLLIGLGAITLGILALAGMNPLVLSLIAMLSIGFSDILSGTTIIGRFKGMSRRHQEQA